MSDREAIPTPQGPAGSDVTTPECRPGPLHVVTAAPPAVFVPGDLRALPAVADLIELRLDLLPPDVDVRAWIEASPRPVLATLRSRAQGGAFRGKPDEAAARLLEAARCGAAWIDVEEAVAPRLDRLPAGVRLLASEHAGRPLGGHWALDDARFDGVKIARRIGRPAQLGAVLAEARAAPPRAFVVPYDLVAEVRTACVGPHGFLFGSASPESAAAPGQPPLQVLVDEGRAGEVDADAVLFGLVGAPPSRSPSPAIHNAVFRAAGRDALYVPLSGMPVEEALGLPVQGLSITMPEKARAVQYADRLDPAAAATGVVNTLVRSDTGWRGLNTDVEALRGAVPQARPGATAYVYGSGGYTRAAVYALRARGYGVRVAARDEAKAVRLAQGFSVAYAAVPYEREPTDAVIVNATPAGAGGASVDAFESARLDGLCVLDAPYAPPGRPTGLVGQARAQGAARVVDGRALLAAQAVGQARAFAGDFPVPDDLARIVALALDPPPNLVLLGARGAGKTTVGRAVARRLGRPFVDLDEEIARVTGRGPAAWIRGEGWEAFREVEREALERARGRRGAVLAPGGGVVETPACRELLAGDGVCVWLRVDETVAAARLSRDAGDRPPLPAGTTERRVPFWRELADVVVDAGADLEQVTGSVARAWCEHRTCM